MAKSKEHFFCRECGYESAKWMGQCPMCRAWNSFVEAPEERRGSGRTASPLSAERPRKIQEISAEAEDRIGSGFREFDRVLGGGIVVGSLLLLGGDPGIGKSTILLETARNLGKSGHKVLYVSGEESLHQIKLRANRIGEIQGEVYFLSETKIESILRMVEELAPELLVIDSIQTMQSEAVPQQAGSVSQVRECTSLLLRIAKENGIAVFLVGHVTKDGNVAGPKILEHMVDAVLYLEGEDSGDLRILHGQKNRFGSTNEIAVFSMSGEGLSEVRNPSEMLLSGRPTGSPGSVVSCGMEGTRPLLMEIQGLVVPTSFGLPRRTSNGIDYNRLNLLLAIIERRLGLEMSRFDAYLNLAGGLRINEPSLDLAIVLSLISSARNLLIPEDAMVFGEVGLSGEVRAVSAWEQRVEEAIRLGFRKIMLPVYHFSRRKKRFPEEIEFLPVKNIREALTLLKK